MNMITRYKIRYRRPFRRYTGNDDNDEIIIRATTEISAREKWEQLVKAMKWNNNSLEGEPVKLIEISPV